MSMCGRILALSIAFLGMMAAAPDAKAWSFWWSKNEVNTNSWNSCMNFASDAARNQHLNNIRKDRLAVSGELNGASATITCIGTAGRAMAVVMVVADTDRNEAARQLQAGLATAITRITCFEGC